VCQTGFVSLQVNARKVYDEANVLAGILSNQLFLAILLGEASLQVRFENTAVLCADQWEAGTALRASCFPWGSPTAAFGSG